MSMDMELDNSTIAAIRNNTIHSGEQEFDRGTLVNELTTAVPPLSETAIPELAAVQAPDAAMAPVEAQGNQQAAGDDTAGPGGEDIKRTQCGVRRNEYAILVHVYRQLLTLPNDVRVNYGQGLRDQLANFTGVGFSTAQKAIRYSKAGKIPADEASKVGRKPKVLDENYGARIKEIVDRMNRDNIPASAVRIQAALRNEYGHEVTLTMLRRDLLRLGLKWFEGPSTRASTWKTRPDPPRRGKKKDKNQGAEAGAMGAVGGAVSVSIQ
ncbi:MAG: hypothetical protein J3Q66DRAFT_437972 [Benniella sp.]|nr:MAG: hypothetical protein J3Q66DRAFT_437972 [Benniella sp.]